MKRTELEAHPASRGGARSAGAPTAAASPPPQHPVGQAESPACQCLSEISSGGTPARADIAPQDWDLLFRAVLETLARVAVDKTATEGKGLQARGSMLRECLDALDQLRRSMPV